MKSNGNEFADMLCGKNKELWNVSEEEPNPEMLKTKRPYSLVLAPPCSKCEI